LLFKTLCINEIVVRLEHIKGCLLYLVIFFNFNVFIVFNFWSIDRVEETKLSKNMTISSKKNGAQRTSASSTVFSRLSAPTKATMGKSKREEDKTVRDEWRKTMDSQRDQEESNMNMGGYALKEQRYKKLADSKSPIGTHYKKRPSTAIATGEVRTNYNGTKTQKQPTSTRNIKSSRNSATSQSYTGNF
jgi:hypothetical protein